MEKITLKQFQKSYYSPFFDYNKFNKNTKIPSGYLFRDGRIIDFEKIILNNINFQNETGALRIRTTPNEINVDFIAGIKPSKEQLNTIRRLKLPSRKLFFEMVDKNNDVLKGYGGFNKTIFEMEQQLFNFYNKNMFTKTLNQLSKKDIRMAGGKGAALGELMKAGIPVPSGFVILAPVFDEFVKNKKNQKDSEKEILNAFDKLGAKYVAVRSSATAEDSKKSAWAGQLETYLYTTRINLIKNVRKCWQSLFSKRAKFYRKERKLQNKKISVAVVVQKMVRPEVSGVCFTVHPVTKNKNQMVIELVRGLGEKLVQGLVTPDSYIISKNPLKIIQKNKQGREKLSNKKILALAKICAKIEKHFKKPQDIEWAFEKGKFYILQSRPITALK